VSFTKLYGDGYVHLREQAVELLASYETHSYLQLASDVWPSIPPGREIELTIMGQRTIWVHRDRGYCTPPDWAKLLEREPLTVSPGEEGEE
jgi:hypothetical protein